MKVCVSDGAIDGVSTMIGMSADAFMSKVSFVVYAVASRTRLLLTALINTQAAQQRQM